MSISRDSSPRGLRADWVFPVAGPPLHNAVVTMCGGEITAIGPLPHGVPVEDLGRSAILPGLVNAHTHLEFSRLDTPLGRPGIGFADWLGLVIGQRSSARAESDSAVARGLRESTGYGVTTIGEITQAGGANEVDYCDSLCGGTVFLELIAPTAQRMAPALATAAKYSFTAEAWQAGLSPHAPYTVHPQVLAAAAKISTARHMPLAMHLAESREEIDFLRDCRGPLRELLESRGVWDATARPPGSRPLDELRVLSRAYRALVVHGNYLDDEEIEYLGQHRRRMAVVYCPRTHAWFGHARYPLEEFLAAGAVVALGTDSRASSPDLSLLAEMRQVARSFPGLSRSTILELGTLGGARALGLDAQIGTLEPGKRANLAVIDLPGETTADPHEMLLDAAGRVRATWVGGIRVS
jgi:aminodeoxyfutalosine deaminase